MNKKTILATALLLMTVTTGCSFFGNTEKTPVYDIEAPSYEATTTGLNQSSSATVENAAKEGLFSLEKSDNHKQEFINHANGYALTIPDDFKVIDMGDATYRSTLATENTRLEIFTQEFDPEVLDKESYLGYSNKFLENTKDFKKLYDKRTDTDERTTHILTWERRVLSGIPNDRNYYGIIDVVADNKIISCQFTSTKELETKTLHTIADTIEFSKPTVKAKEYPHFSYARNNLNAETQKFYSDYFSDDANFTWGFFQNFENTSKVKDLNAFQRNLLKIENTMDFKFKILLYYSDTSKDNRIYETLVKFRELGATAELTLQTPIYDPATQNNIVYDILEGKHDVFLHDYAQDIVKFGHPVLFRPFNEMNGDWCNYSAFWTGRDCNTYIELYRYIYNIFEEEGANANTLWIWNPNERSFPDFCWNEIDNYYPGDEYVDIVGLTGYNTGDYYEGEIWREFPEIYDPIYNRMEPQYKQPLMITEFSCSNIGGDKAAWVDTMFNQMEKYPRIKAAVWWNGADRDVDGTIARSYYIDDNEEAVKVFQDHFAKLTEQ